jgi:hypothetical protein
MNNLTSLEVKLVDEPDLLLAQAQLMLDSFSPNASK